MKKYIVNKNISHNGKDYPNGSKIDEGCDGFKLLLQAGHLVELEAQEQVVEEQVVEEEPQVIQKKKSKKDTK